MSLPTNPNLIMGGGVPYYNVQRSLRFRASASAYLNRTFGTPTNNKIFTWSAWVKRGALPASTTGLIGSGTSGTNYCYIGFLSGNTLNFQNNASSGNQINATTAAVFRDPSAWYHIVLAVDTTQATNSNGVKIYVNGIQQTLTFGAYTQNTNTILNSAAAHVIGNYISGGGLYFDGYLSEINFIDGQALTPSSFGYTDPTTGVWMPEKYNGTYGTNGFYLPFTNTTNTTNLCLDASGNGNNWTPNNISVTSGVTYDSMLDVPTNWGDGGNGRGNYATLNPVFPSGGTYSNANLKFVGPTAWANARSTIELPSSGKWYFEATVIANGQNNTLGSSYSYVGVTATSTTPSALGYNGANFVTLNDTGWLNNNATTSNAVGAALAANNLIGIAIDVDNNTFTFYRTNSSVASGTIGMSAGTPLVFVNGSYSAAYGNFDVNFGQRPFVYTPPSGFKALNTLNLPMPTILNGAKYMAATIYAGNGTTQTISNGTNSGNNFLGTTFQPDFVWVKNRTGAYDNILSNSISGANLSLYSNRTLSEQTNNSGGYINSFNATGFSPITGSTNALDTNATSNNYVAWQWNAGSGVTSSNTSGTVTSTVSANVTAGFSVVTWTGTGATNATVGHGLSVLPNMVIIKKRNVVENWYVAHTGSGQGINFAYHLFLNTTGALSGSNDPYLLGTQISTTSNVLALADGTSNNGGNQSGTTYVAYCFAGVAGYSKFGSFTGNGSTDGPFIYTGFLPRFVMYKRTDSTSSWFIQDTTRQLYNVQGPELYPDSSSAEGTATRLDFLSNGFKIRAAAATNPNVSGATYIYAAFAENPFNVSRAR